MAGIGQLVIDDDAAITSPSHAQIFGTSSKRHDCSSATNGDPERIAQPTIGAHLAELGHIAIDKQRVLLIDDRFLGRNGRGSNEDLPDADQTLEVLVDRTVLFLPGVHLFH